MTVTPSAPQAGGTGGAGESSPAPPVWPDLWTTLERLKIDRVWTLEYAGSQFQQLRELQIQRMLCVAPSEAGPMVLLDMEGRRVMNLNPYAHVSLEKHADLLYLRLAVRALGWTLVREPFAGRRKEVGRLDRLAVVSDGTKTMRVMARCTSGGYSPKSVGEVFNFIRTTLLTSNETLVVIVPRNSKIQLMHGRKGLLDIIEYSVDALSLPGEFWTPA